MCGDCLKVHRKQKISKDHVILSTEELACNPENILKLAEGFTCSEHDEEDIKYYCKDHKVPCCGVCFFHGHKMCSKVIDLKEELPALLHEYKPYEILEDMKTIENHIRAYMEMNEASVNNLETQVNGLAAEIAKLRNEINYVLDELEIRVRTEGNRIYKEELIRKQDENHQCLSLIHSVRNSHYLFEAVDKYWSNLQKFLTTEKMKGQVRSYCNLVGEKYEKVDSITIELQFVPKVKSILCLFLSDVGNVAATVSSNTLPLTRLRGPAKDCPVEKVDVIDVKVFNGNTPWYSSVTFLPGDKVMLGDNNNRQCILLNSSYQFITSHTLSDDPWNICVLDDQLVAVSLYKQNNIQILSVVDDDIMSVRTIKTKHSCNGIAAAGNGDIVVNDYCGNETSQLSVITTTGDVKCLHQYESPYYKESYVVMNSTKTRVYVSVNTMNALLCFDINGRKQFTYGPDNLRDPHGVSVDRYDNIYVLGYSSNNIHQLSPDGSTLQVITSGVPKWPWAICIHKSKDTLIITNNADSDRKKILIYQVKNN